MGILLFGIVFLFFIAFVLCVCIPISRDHYKATGNVMNYDFMMKKFVYKVPLTRTDIVRRLKIRNVADELTCVIDVERGTVVFSEYGSRCEYYFYVDEYDGFSVLRLEQVPSFEMKSGIPVKLNPFLVNKLQAEIVPFFEYSF